MMNPPDLQPLFIVETCSKATLHMVRLSQDTAFEKEEIRCLTSKSPSPNRPTIPMTLTATKANKYLLNNKELSSNSCVGKYHAGIKKLRFFWVF
jgi:hypothetical protein